MNRRILPALRVAAAAACAAMLLPSLPSDAAARDSGWDRHDERGRGHDRKYKHDRKHKHDKWDRHGHDRWDRHDHYCRPVRVVYVRPPARPYRNSINVYIGSFFGTVLDGNDRYNVQYALETVPTGNAVVWNNAATGYRYSVTPVRTWQAPDATYCREYTTVGNIGGRQQQLYGKACRQPDGSWETQ